KVLADVNAFGGGILAGPEGLGHRFIDDHDVRRTLPIAAGEGSTPPDRDPHGFEILGGYGCVIGSAALEPGNRVPPGDPYLGAVSGPEWIGRGQADIRDPR